MDNQGRPNIVRTPLKQIPIGEAVKKPDGHYSLIIKKAKSSEVEEVALDTLFHMVMKEAEK